MISIYYSSPNPMISSILQNMDLGCCFLVFVKHIVVVWEGLGLFFQILNKGICR